MQSKLSIAATGHAASEEVGSARLPQIPSLLMKGVVCCFLVALVWLAFGHSVHNDFVNYDDDDYVYRNPKITAGLTWSGVVWAFTHVHASNWHPLTSISHMLDCQIYGVQPWGHHLTNVLLHALASVLLFLALRKLTRDAPVAGIGDAARDQRSRLQLWACAFVAALFAIHPLRVESVSWVSERKDVFSGIFFMLTLWGYAGYAREKSHRTRRYLLVIMFFTLGLLCKPTLVTVPFVLLLLDFWPLNRMRRAKGEARKEESGAWSTESGAWSTERGAGSRGGSGTSEDASFSTTHLSTGLSRRNRMKAEAFAKDEPLSFSTSLGGLLAEKIPLFALSALSCVVTVWAQGHALDPMKRLTLVERSANAVVSYGSYLYQTFYPLHLAVFYPYPTGFGLVDELVPLLLLFALISIAVLLFRSKLPFLVVGWLWFLGMLAPMIGLIQAGSQAHADRYTYLSHIGLYVLLTWGAIRLCRKWRRATQALAVLAFLLIATLTARSYQEGFSWRNSESLWRHTLQNTSNNYVAHNNLGHSLVYPAQLDEAIFHFREAIRLKEDYVEAHNNLADALMQNLPNVASDHLDATIDEAITHLERALQVKPDFAEAWTNLATAMVQKGNVDEAIKDYHRALELAPDLPEANGNLGNALLEQGKTDDAIASYYKAIELRPAYADAHHGLGRALIYKGRFGEAIQELGKTLELEPNNVAARYEFGSILLENGQLPEAVEQLKRVVAASPSHPEAHHNLGVGLARTEDLDGAISEYKKAIELRPHYAQAESDLGNVLLRKGSIDDATAHLEKAIDIDPMYAEAYNDLGNASMMKRDVLEAIHRYSKAITLRPEYAEAHSNLGNAYLQHGEIDKAIQEDRKAVDLKPTSAPMQLNLGNALAAKGNAADAISCYQAALRVQPGYGAAKQQLQKLGVSQSQ